MDQPIDLWSDHLPPRPKEMLMAYHNGSRCLLAVDKEGKLSEVTPETHRRSPTDDEYCIITAAFGRQFKKLVPPSLILAKKGEPLIADELHDKEIPEGYSLSPQ